MTSLHLLGTPFIELLSVDSTNNYAMGLARAAMASHGTAVFAHEQTKGRGQRSREWTSASGQNIALSLIIRPESLAGKPVFLLSMAAALGVHSFVSAYAGEGFTIKWPNDLYWRDRKAAGILIENLWQGQDWRYSVIGMGVNVNQTDFGALGLKAVSLKQITGKSYNPSALARELCLALEPWMNEIARDPGKIREAYRRNLYRKDENVRLRKGSRVFTARLIDVTENGQLVVMHTAEEKFDVGDVEWII